jgi:hypothetical protein
MRAISWAGTVSRADDVEYLLAERSDTYTVYRSAASGDGVTASRGDEAEVGDLVGRVDALKAWQIVRAAEAGVQVGSHVFIGRVGEVITLQRGDRLVGGDGREFRVVTVAAYGWKVEARLTEVN